MPDLQPPPSGALGTGAGIDRKSMCPPCPPLDVAGIKRATSVTRVAPPSSEGYGKAWQAACVLRSHSGGDLLAAPRISAGFVPIPSHRKRGRHFADCADAPWPVRNASGGAVAT